MIDKEYVRRRRPAIVTLASALALAVIWLCVRGCDGGNYEQKGWYLLDTRNGEVWCVGADTLYRLGREPKASIFHWWAGRYRFADGDDCWFIYDGKNGDVYMLEYSDDYEGHEVVRRIPGKKVCRRLQ